MDVHGCHMFILVSKLKALKARLKKWHKGNFSFLDTRIHKVETQLSDLSAAIQVTHPSPEVFDQEMSLLLKLRNLKKAQHVNLQQRCKIDFIICNDENSKFFFARLSAKKASSYIHSIINSDGISHSSPDGVASAFVNLYTSLIGSMQNEGLLILLHLLLVLCFLWLMQILC